MVMLKHVCAYCGKEFERKLDYVKLDRNKHFYCSKECFNKSKIKGNKYIIHENYAEIVIFSQKFGEQKVKIDLDDVERCKKITWCLTKKNYVTSRRGTDNKYPLLHRFLLKPQEHEQIDHINRDKLDNRKHNLRICDNFINAQNKSTNNDTVGVSWSKTKNKWRAYISKNKKQISLGYYFNKKDAIEARLKAEKTYYNYTQ